MTTQVHRAMMVQEAYAEMAQKLVAVFAPVSGPGMFVTPVYDVNGVIRYRASNGPIDPELAPLVDDPTGNAMWTEIQARGLSAPEYTLSLHDALPILHSLLDRKSVV